MRNAGYADASWTMLVQTYPSPIPNGSGFRYSESGYTRQSTGGCGFWNADANWANGTALPTINNAVTGAITQAGHHQRAGRSTSPRRSTAAGCARTPSASTRRSGCALDLSRRGRPDRVGQPDPHRVDLLLQQPVLHPGVAAPELLGPARHSARCVRQAYNGGTPRGGHVHRSRHRAGQRRAGDVAVLAGLSPRGSPGSVRRGRCPSAARWCRGSSSDRPQPTPCGS